MTARVIDMHTHFIPEDFLDDIKRSSTWEIEVQERDGHRWFVHDQGYAYPVQDEFFGEEARFADMERRGVDHSILSITPTLFYYWIAAAEAASFARMANEALADVVKRSGGRLSGLATLPLQAPDVAAAELRRAVQELGLVGAEIGTSVEDRQLDDPAFQPIWEAANELRVPIVLHPYYIGPKAGFHDYYLVNSFGNPLDTAIAAARITMSGLLDRFTELRFALVHAGGFLPFQMGRLDHAWKVRPEPKVRTSKPPTEYLEHFYFDTITHADSPLSWLVDYAGADHVMLGSDLPFDMADVDPVGRVQRAVGENAQETVLGGSASKLFGLDGDASR